MELNEYQNLNLELQKQDKKKKEKKKTCVWCSWNVSTLQNKFWFPNV